VAHQLAGSGAPHDRHARAASDNTGSLKVLQRSGFKVTGTETSFATARNAEIEETILRLD
jgi:RimJ/RimL family protein N-acetyltransferase